MTHVNNDENKWNINVALITKLDTFVVTFIWLLVIFFHISEPADVIQGIKNIVAVWVLNSDAAQC